MNDDSILQRIADKSITEKELVAQVNLLGNINEPPLFWLNIANNTTYPALHRAISVCQLFRRHITAPISINKLAEILQAPSWINTHTVTTIDHLKGEIPVEWNINETVLAINLFSAERTTPYFLYLRFSEKIDANIFIDCVTLDQHTGKGDDVMLLEAACSVRSDS